MKKIILTYEFDSHAELVKHCAQLDAAGINPGNATISEGTADKAANSAKDKATEKAADAATTTSKKKTAESYDDLDADGKLAHIGAEITKHTKKGKSRDIKKLLSVVGVSRATDAKGDVEALDKLWSLVSRYSAGESVDEIVGEETEEDLS